MIETTVSVPQFEGPLGLLLQLVEQGQFEVTDIAVAAITSQYLARVATMDELNRDELAQFLELGARLVFIKSAALLPTTDDNSSDSPAGELRQLNEELAEYRLMRQASDHLKRQLSRGQRSYPRSVKTQVDATELPMPALELNTLSSVFQDALKRSLPEPETMSVRIDYDQQVIGDRLIRDAERHELKLAEILAACRDRVEIIVTFLALLEAIRSEAVSVRQSQLFDDVYIVAL